MEPSKAQEKSKRPTPDPHPRLPRGPGVGEWIKLKSRSYGGRPFYIHTATGTSVWNLSDIEFAKYQKFENNAIRAISIPKEAAPDKTVPQETRKELPISWHPEATKRPPEAPKWQPEPPKRQPEALPENREPPKPTTDMPIKRQIINEKVTKLIPPPLQTQVGPNFTQMQPFAPYEAPPINITVPPPKLSTAPLFQPQISIPNYPPPPLQTQLLSYPPPPVMPYYTQPQMNVPNFSAPSTPNFNILNGPSFGNMYSPVGVLVQSTAVSMSSRFKTINVENKFINKALVDEDNPSTELEKTKKPTTVIVSNALLEPESPKNPTVVHSIRPLNVKPRHYKQFSRSPLIRPQKWRNEPIKDLREILQAKRSKNNTKKVRFQTDEDFIAEDQMPFIQENNERDIENQMTHLNVGDNANITSKRDEPEQTTNDDGDDEQTVEASATVSDDIEMINADDTEWLQKNTAEKNTEQLYVKPLKVLLGCGDEDLWYVVADTNVFLSNCYFLDSFVNSDENCRILVSCRVITELEGRVTQGGSEASQEAAFAAINFLESSPRVVTDEMLFAKIKVNVRFTTGDDQILDCVLRLSQHNFRVLLLSNDQVLNSKTKISNVITFTVSELKEYLSSIKTPTEEAPEITQPILITFNNSPKNTPNSVAKELAPETANKSTEIQMSPVRNIADSGAQTDFSPKQILIEIPNTRTLVDKDVQTTDDLYKDDNAEKDLKLTRKVNAETATEIERVSRNEKRSKWWSRRRKRETNSNSVSTSTDTDTLPKFDKNQSKSKTVSIQSSLKTDSNTQSIETFIAKSNTDSEDSFALSKRFSASHLMSDSSQLQPRTVEESPCSSDAISNTRSSISPVNNDLEYSENNLAGIIDGDLFDVSDKAMEDRLKRCSEEWTSRYVQIMDEVLTQVLRQNPLANSPHQPPWTLREAADCIRDKYYNNSAIVNAATQFLFTVYASTDKMGNIFRTLNPDRFMKLFSYGWSLVVVLQQVLSGRPGSEDLAVAKDSLTKLLSDIKGHNSDSIDHFVDISADEYLKHVNINALEPEQMVGGQGDMYPHYESPSTKSAILQNPNTDPVLTQAISDYVKINRTINNNDEALMKYMNSYNTTSQFDHDEFTQSIHRTPDHSPPPEVPGLMADASFSPRTPEITSLINRSPKITSLINRSPKITSLIKRGPKITSPIIESKKITKSFKNIAEFEEKIRKDNELGRKSIEMRSQENLRAKKDTVIAKNLQKFAEYEERLRTDTERLDMDMLSYSEDEYDVQDERYNDYGEVINGDDDLLEASDEYKVDAKLDEESEMMIKTFLADMKDTFLQIHSYCEQTYLELSNDKLMNAERKLELKEQTEDKHAYLNSLLSSLNSILLRENNSEVNFKQYRYSDVIGKCSTQVKILLDVLNSIMREMSVKG